MSTCVLDLSACLSLTYIWVLSNMCTCLLYVCTCVHVFFMSAYVSLTCICVLSNMCTCVPICLHMCPKKNKKNNLCVLSNMCTCVPICLHMCGRFQDDLAG